ncbi:MAG: FAD-dependent oxidoreductase, partial [Acidobacteriota bacterium]
MERRDALKWLAGLGATAVSAQASFGRRTAPEVLVVGAGVFGVWTARALHQAGKRVAVVDAVAPAHSRASSGGESRVTRCGYGDLELYTEWACRSLAEWRALSQRAALPLFHETGVLWIHHADDNYVNATAKTLAKHEVPYQHLSTRELAEHYPVLATADEALGFLEPRGGALMARRAVQTLASELQASGVRFIAGEVQPIRAADGVGGSLPSVRTTEGEVLAAEQFVFACGPWLDQVCPEAMAGRLFVTRQEVLYFAAGRRQTGNLPVWADLPFYGVPSLEGRGFKVANDTHGAVSDPDTMDRNVSREAEEQARQFLARRFPKIAENPVVESRVCQYENSSNGDLVVDRHPGLANVWLAGCGSGHGFKHGP